MSQFCEQVFCESPWKNNHSKCVGGGSEWDACECTVSKVLRVFHSEFF